MGKDVSGSMFDLNRDSKPDASEMAEACHHSHEAGTADKDCADHVPAKPGLDWDELSQMDDDERRDALESAGLDPEEYVDL